MDSRFPKEISEVRKIEVRNTFKRLVAYAIDNGVSVILLAGDVFDSDHPFKKDKEFFYSVVRANPQIDFLYLRGNHDQQSSYEGDELSNLKTFGDHWSSYNYGNVTISAIEITAENATSLYSTLSLNANQINLVMLHGQLADCMEKDKIKLSKLRDKNIDYLALGHIHKYTVGKLDERGTYAYCGCPEGRGFDETGEKGFILLDVGERVTQTFVSFAEREIIEKEVNISGLTDAYAVSNRVKEQVKFERKYIYRVRLTGDVTEIMEGISKDVQKYLKDECLYLDIKEETRKKIDIRSYEGDLSLRGEFVRMVYADKTLSEEDKARILSYGLFALASREIEE
jgi:DNA repair exonuclease SbcCD nuclease subunit